MAILSSSAATGSTADGGSPPVRTRGNPPV